jgi:glycosyltransferase involved in cell wall biosynthesis
VIADCPLVSVIIPVYNGERYLAEAVQSVLAQTYAPVEIIVVDDGSTDGTADVAKHFAPVQYVRQANSGVSAARNRGLELARGEFLAFLDADDLWVADKLARQTEAFTTDPQLDMVFGHVRQFYSPELDQRARSKIQCPSEPMRGPSPSSMLIKRVAFFRVGLFETQWRGREWPAWYVRAVDLGLSSLMLPEVVALRRLHASNKGLEPSANADFVHILKASLDRRRARPE